MGAVLQKIPNLLGGVSQQPDPVKLPGQVREAENVYLDPTFGCRKRPATKFVGELATNLPSDTRWFPIFRDAGERYAVALYKDGSGNTQVRVWDMQTGAERTVTPDATATAYLATTNLNNLNWLTVADYTLLSNKERIVTMSGASEVDSNQRALVEINAISYNTTYSIDLDRDGASQQVKVYRAKALEISPGSFEVEDGGVCTEHDVQNYTNQTIGSSTGLAFQVRVQCAAYLENNEYRSRYNVSVVLQNGGTGFRKGDMITVNLNGRDYNIRVTQEEFVYTYASDGTAAHTTPQDSTAGTLDIGQITAGLVNSVNLISNYSAQAVGNVIEIERTDGRDFNLGVRGGATNRAMTAIKGTANSIVDLPGQCFDGFELKVINTENAESDDYYVVFRSAAEGIPGSGSWEETVAPGIERGFNTSTMPHALIRQADGNFTLEALNDEGTITGWAQREVGDDDTNPKPSFVGRGISDMFFYNNRLGFLSEDAVIMSQPGDYFNFFVTSAITISDSDPIDVTASSTKPAILRAAIGAPKGLILFAENSQFLLASQEVVFSTATIKLTEISDYFYRSLAKPVSTGVSIAFVSEADTYSKIFEMSIDSVDNRPQVADITRIVPEYVPTGLTWSVSTPNNSMMLFGDNSNTAYIFKFFNQGNERQVAGWSKWILPGEQRMCGFFADTGYFVLYDSTTGSYVLSAMELLDDPDSASIDTAFSSFLPRLDNYVVKSDLTVVDNGDGTLTVDLEAGQAMTGATPVIMFTDGPSEFAFSQPTITAGQFTVDTTDDFVVGFKYETKITLPGFFTSEENKADRVYAPIVEFLYLDLYYSGRYQIEVDRIGYDTINIDAGSIDANIYLADGAPLKEIATENVPLFTPGDQVTVTIKAPDPFPSAITGYSWQGHYNRRGIAFI
ncbi:tail protein [Synechococcus phage Syn5]|uniref:Tail tube B n=1 Tax=Synechococcus phage Syn5 TaxID=2914003 RepID=A4ZRC2_9CAUD|nr:tail protein [Synechococcus phage Syn5]ABP87948.1 tail tube B [Synechococcus phage Syn5]